MALFLPILALASVALCERPVVHDGDSIRCGMERVRIANIDAPELPSSPKCHTWPRSRYAWCDYTLGAASRAALIVFLARGPMMIRRTGIDRYGRTLALVSVNGIDAGAWLVDHRLARPWIE